MRWRELRKENAPSKLEQSVFEYEGGRLGNWNWRFAWRIYYPPWKALIKLKYNTKEGDWFTREPRGSYGVSVWKDIKREASELKQKRGRR